MVSDRSVCYVKWLASQFQADLRFNSEQELNAISSFSFFSVGGFDIGLFSHIHNYKLSDRKTAYCTNIQIHDIMWIQVIKRTNDSTSWNVQNG